MRVLVVDDEAPSLYAVSNFLRIALGQDVVACENGKEAVVKFKNDPFQVLITDYKMQGMNGLDLIRQIREMKGGRECVIVMMTGFADKENVIEALRLGAYDYLEKPIEAVTLSALFEKLSKELITTSITSTESIRSDSKFNDNQGYVISIPDYGSVGVFSAAMHQAIELALRFHEDRAVPILIEGETGTGKEVIARLVHHGIERNQTAFISVNCSAIASGLFESELFGYASGAFTGASQDGNIGKLELAHEGTLFLDEIGDMPIEMQPKLLRVLEEREIYRVGGAKRVSLNIRIIAATNSNLIQAVEENGFRRDLFHRLNVGRIQLSPLRETPEAIVPIAQMFLEEFSKKKHKTVRQLSPEAQDILTNYKWMGNIRELKNCIERVLLLQDEKYIRAEHFAFLTQAPAKETTNQEIPINPGVISLPPDGLNLKELEDGIILKTFEKFNGNKSKTAKYLGIARGTLISRLEKLL